MTPNDGMGVKEPGMSKPEIEAIAADWVVRLDDGALSPDDQARLDGWLSENPAHRDAFDHACVTWRDLGALHLETAFAASEPSNPQMQHRGSAVSRRGSTNRPAERNRRHASSWARRSVRAGMLAVALMVTAGLASLWEGDPVSLMTADLRTGPGETRTETLPDGSEVLLGPSSALALRYDSSLRGFELLSGVAYVTAAPKASDPGERPFRIEANQGWATALGTRFMVEKIQDAVRVTVAEHDVEVASGTNPAKMQKVVLHPGDSVRYSDSAGLGEVQRVSLTRATGWREGRLVFDRVPLSDVVAVLNRYRHGRIVVANPSLGDRTVSGSFNATDLDHALQAITEELDATTADLPPFVTLLF